METTVQLDGQPPFVSYQFRELWEDTRRAGEHSSCAVRCVCLLVMDLSRCVCFLCSDFISGCFVFAPLLAVFNVTCTELWFNLRLNERTAPVGGSRWNLDLDVF